MQEEKSEESGFCSCDIAQKKHIIFYKADSQSFLYSDTATAFDDCVKKQSVLLLIITNRFYI